ncbi:hypothetical protein HZS_949 [Henneguya salminicola]|nr:hypothetical protein HZS_949 [Henneguya salminicola]
MHNDIIARVCLGSQRLPYYQKTHKMAATKDSFLTFRSSIEKFLSIGNLNIDEKKFIYLFLEPWNCDQNELILVIDEKFDYWIKIYELIIIKIDHENSILLQSIIIYRTFLDSYNEIHLQNSKFIDFLHHLINYSNSIDVDVHTFTINNILNKFMKNNFKSNHLDILIYWLSNRKEENYKNWKQKLLNEIERFYSFFDALINIYDFKSTKILQDTIEPYLYCCICAFDWFFEDIPKILILLKNIKQLITLNHDNISLQFLHILHDFILKKINVVANPSKLVGFSHSSHYIYIEILNQLLICVKSNNDIIIHTIEQVFSVCLLDDRQDFQTTYLKFIPKFMSLLENYAVLFLKKFINYICFCLPSPSSSNTLFIQFRTQSILKAVCYILKNIPTSKKECSLIKIVIRLWYNYPKIDTNINNQLLGLFKECFIFFENNLELKDFTLKIKLENPYFFDRLDK